ncbi:MAG: hypothetical protein Q8Q59_10845 [Luteolibacter sp.]|jgi:hypothetical protein|nr:hypothetical protein [Luteolibacter sp.]
MPSKIGTVAVFSSVTGFASTAGWLRIGPEIEKKAAARKQALCLVLG